MVRYRHERRGTLKLETSSPIGQRRGSLPKLGWLIVVGLNLGWIAYAQQPDSTKTNTKISQEPVDIRSDQLVVQQKKRVAEFLGHVLAVQGELTIRCDQLVVTYSEGKQSNSGSSEITQMIFSGSVTIEQKNRLGHCERAEYDRQNGRIVCTGNPWVMEGENRITGKQIVYWLDRDEVKVTEPRVNIRLPKDGQKGGSKP